MDNREQTFDYIDYIMNEVSEEKIEKLFEEMGIEINIRSKESKNK